MSRAKRALVLVVLAIASLFAWSREASAHDVRGEVMFLDVGERVVRVELQVPKALLTLAREQSTEPDLSRYLAQNLSAIDRNGTAFSVRIESTSLRRVGDGDVMIAKAVLTAPSGSSARYFDLRDDVVLRRVISDNVYVFLRRDLESAVMEGEPELLGVMHYQQRDLLVDRSKGSRFTGFSTMFATGMRHIGEGTDHLLFLLMLLLPASLLVDPSHVSRWGGSAPTKKTWKETAKIVSAFTLGHTLSLGAAVTGLVSLSEKPIEVLVAVTVLASALHAIRPVFARREVFVAGAFGLVHGLAFATALQGIGLDGPTLAIGLLGFNFGVEAAQLLAVVAVMPFLASMSRHRHYAFLRIAIALLGGVAASAWIADRAFAIHTRIPAMVELVAAHKPAIVISLAAGSLLFSLFGRPSHSPTAARERPVPAPAPSAP